MSESWMIAVVTAILSWLAYEVHRINDKLDGMVCKADCSADMGDHCDQIKALRSKVQDNSEELSALRAKIEAM